MFDSDNESNIDELKWWIGSNIGITIKKENLNCMTRVIIMRFEYIYDQEEL
jgi:hypothetical protein